MKFKNRVFAILLALTMVVTFMPALAFADDESVDEVPVQDGTKIKTASVNTDNIASVEFTHTSKFVVHDGDELNAVYGAIYSEGSKVTATYEDGSEEEFEYSEVYDEDAEVYYRGFYNEDGDELGISYAFVDENIQTFSFENNKVKICLLDNEDVFDTVEVTVKAALKGLKFVSGDTEIAAFEGEDVWAIHSSIFSEGSKVTLTYEDESEEVFEYISDYDYDAEDYLTGFYNEDRDELEIGYAFVDENIQTFSTKNSSNAVKIYVAGKNEIYDTIKVTIKDIPTKLEFTSGIEGGLTAYEGFSGKPNGLDCDGSKVVLTYVDGTKKTYEYDYYDEWNGLREDGFDLGWAISGEDDEAVFSKDNKTVTLYLRSTATYTGFDVSATVDVTLKASPQEITAWSYEKTLTGFEGTSKIKEYLNSLEGVELDVLFSDNSTKKFVCSKEKGRYEAEDGSYAELEYYLDPDDDEVTFSDECSGITIYIYMYEETTDETCLDLGKADIQGLQKQVNVSSAPAKVKGIEFTPAATSKYTAYVNCTYPMDLPSAGDKLEVSFDDNTSENFTYAKDQSSGDYDFFDENGERLDSDFYAYDWAFINDQQRFEEGENTINFIFCDNISYDLDEWADAGDEYVFTDTVTVNTVESYIDKITFNSSNTKMLDAEETGEEDYDDETDTYWTHYYYDNYQLIDENDTLTVVFKNDSTKYTYTAVYHEPTDGVGWYTFENKDVTEYPSLGIDIYDDQSVNNQWEVGKSYKVVINIDGAEDTFPVLIKGEGDHVHTPAAAVVENKVEATCSEEGSYDEVVYCSECGAELSRETKTIAKTEHNWNEGEVTTEPTCSSEGVKTYTCTVCNATKTETIAKLAHTWDTGVVTKAPTYGAEGERTYTCTVCNETKVEKIAKKTVPATKLTKLAKAKKAFTAKWTKKAGVTGYQIQYGLKSNFKKSKTVTVKGANAASKKIKKLKAKKKYYVRIRTYVTENGKTYYSAWSAKKSVKTK